MQREAIGDAPANIRIPGKSGLPYFLNTDIEDLLLVVSQEMIREVNPMELMAMGSAAAVTVTGSGGSASPIPLNVVNTLDISIDDAPADEISLAGYYQRKGIANGIPVYAFTGVAGVGTILYTGGTNINAQFIVEPPLAVWQSDVKILPPGTDAERIARVFERMQIIT